MADLGEAQQQDLDVLNRAIARAGAVPCSGDDLAISDQEADQREATHLCHQCPILTQCRAYGRVWPKERGIYGGMTEADRAGKHRAPKEPPTPEELERRKALTRERSRRARARRKQNTNTQGEVTHGQETPSPSRARTQRHTPVGEGTGTSRGTRRTDNQEGEAA